MSFSILSKTENAQLDTAIINAELTGLVSLNNLCSETGWEDINDRRENHTAVHFYKTTDKLHNSTAVPPKLRNINGFNTHHSSSAPLVITRTVLCRDVRAVGKETTTLFEIWEGKYGFCLRLGQMLYRDYG